jgi:hypothetical protein
MSYLTSPHVFERGDRIYLTTPLTIARPSDSEIAEFAFASSVKSKAPNENLGWVAGRYVEAGKANLNKAMWLNDELALKSLTPMLMPVTVMHDPRTAVGTIADCKLIGDDQKSRIDTILAVWRHRFPEVWEETVANIENAEMMQSMECYAPNYSCSECGQEYVKLAKGAEQSSWCAHLAQSTASRILGDVCFTGTGLIFGSRGAKGAYTEAYLGNFENEIAESHQRAHVDSTYRPSEGSHSTMGLVQIEESELKVLRDERNEAKAKVETLATENRDLTSKVEKAEAEALKEKEGREKAEKENKDLSETAQRNGLKDKRLGSLGDGFLAKLGEFTRGRLTEAAGTQSDEEWEATVKEKEEMAGCKRDLKKDETPAGGDPASVAAAAFSDAEVASFLRSGVTTPAVNTGAADGTGAVRKLAAAFAPPAASTSNGDGK